MKERPILMSAPMVRAILDGRKTQTRRAINWARVKSRFQSRGCFDETGYDTLELAGPGHGNRIVRRPWAGGKHIAQSIVSPFGRPCDRLWVKETFLPTRAGVFYRADFNDHGAAVHGALYGGWKPSIFMRNVQSRILLEVTAVRVERLLDISESDAKAEGADIMKLTAGGQWVVCGPAIGTHRDGYRWLWQKINGEDSWFLNPWVWVVDFQRVR